MYAAREEERNECGCVIVDFHEGDRAMVDVAEEEEVDGTIPFSGKLIP